MSILAFNKNKSRTGRYSGIKLHDHVQKTYMLVLGGVIVSVLFIFAFQDFMNQRFGVVYEEGRVLTWSDYEGVMDAIFVAFAAIGVMLITTILSIFIRDEAVLTVLYFFYTAATGIALSFILVEFFFIENGMEIIIIALLWTIVIFGLVVAISNQITLPRKYLRRLWFFILYMLVSLIAFSIGIILFGLENLFYIEAIVGAIIYSFVLFFYIQANKQVVQPSVILAWGIFATLVNLFLHLLEIVAKMKE